MTKPEDAKTAPAGPRSGLDANKRLGNAVMPRSYRDVATAASAPVATAYEVVLDHLVRSTLEHAGSHTYPMSKWAAAIHEAGHAVLSVAEGEPVRTVRIRTSRRRDKTGWTCQTAATASWTVDASTSTSVLMRRVRVELAGVIAEAIHIGDYVRSGPSLDARARALMLAHRGCTDPDVVVRYQAKRAAETLERNRVALLALADALEAEERLQGRRLSALLALVREAGR